MKANKEKVIKYLHMAQGQLKGIERMIENDEYCIDISNQLMASTALLKKPAIVPFSRPKFESIFLQITQILSLTAL